MRMLFEPAEVPAAYRCPLCPNHVDEDFRDSPILVGQPICTGCGVELDHFLEEEERRDHRVLDRLEAFTGLSFLECRRRHLREKILDMEWRLAPDHATTLDQAQASFTGQPDPRPDAYRRILASARAKLRDLSERGV